MASHYFIEAILRKKTVLGYETIYLLDTNFPQGTVPSGEQFPELILNPKVRAEISKQVSSIFGREYTLTVDIISARYDGVG